MEKKEENAANPVQSLKPVLLAVNMGIKKEINIVELTRPFVRVWAATQ